MRKIIFVGSPEGSSEESLARIDEAIAQIREKADALRAALAEDRLDEMQRLTESEYRENTLVRLSETHQQLDEALETLNLDSFASFYPGEFEEDKEAEEQEEYELIGCIDGTYGGRWMISVIAENASAVWPDGTALYVRVEKSE